MALAGCTDGALRVLACCDSPVISSGELDRATASNLPSSAHVARLKHMLNIDWLNQRDESKALAKALARAYRKQAAADAGWQMAVYMLADKLDRIFAVMRLDPECTRGSMALATVRAEVMLHPFAGITQEHMRALPDAISGREMRIGDLVGRCAGLITPRSDGALEAHRVDVVRHSSVPDAASFHPAVGCSAVMYPSGFIEFMGPTSYHGVILTPATASPGCCAAFMVFTSPNSDAEQLFPVLYWTILGPARPELADQLRIRAASRCVVSEPSPSPFNAAVALTDLAHSAPREAFGATRQPHPGFSPPRQAHAKRRRSEKADKTPERAAKTAIAGHARAGASLGAANDDSDSSWAPGARRPRHRSTAAAPDNQAPHQRTAEGDAQRMVLPWQEL
ncbi:hypothetical protein JKP88DRAFT_273100 [Tribonema minus]|uniref:Uncharacterized protein n=1 Tax=Tribonema minus TaxID=303371 RepID=A0A835Z6H2_9STRA|nr:hypothetical protein JKP88DRAFT_273100 [Tribonema minus]